LNNGQYDLTITHDQTEDLAYHCAVHTLPSTHIVYPVAVTSLKPEHRQALPDIKLRALIDYILPQHQAILMSAGNETTGGRFSFQTQIEYAISHGIHAYQLDGSMITSFDDKEALQAVLARPWNLPLPLVLLSGNELPLDAKYPIPADLIESLDRFDARAVFEV
jgi:hypothetical protein